jgi:XRE family transcriptional regulator, regulator of sulfur utilization
MALTYNEQLKYISNIGLCFKEIRKLKGIKQGDVSKLLNISQTYISQIENNERSPSLALLNRLCKYYNINIIITCKI